MFSQGTIRCDTFTAWQRGSRFWSYSFVGFDVLEQDHAAIPLLVHCLALHINRSVSFIAENDLSDPPSPSLHPKLLFARSISESRGATAVRVSPLTMVKTTSLTKQELKDVLKGSKTSKERNRAVKLLKQFDPNPDYRFDDEGTKSKMRPKKYDYLQGFVCDRSDKVNVSYHKV